MNKHELLKIYSAYLPYGLKAQYNNGDIITIIGVNTETIQVNCDFTHYGYSDTRIEDVKPILYDLSYLTKEIEHEGEMFVPTRWLRDNHAEFDISKADMEQLISMFIHIFRSPESAPYYFIKKLLEWHFNVFNLPEGECINKATLTQKQ